MAKAIENDQIETTNPYQMWEANIKNRFLTRLRRGFLLNSNQTSVTEGVRYLLPVSNVIA